MYMALAYAWNIVGGYMGYPSFGTGGVLRARAYLGANRARVPCAARCGVAHRRARRGCLLGLSWQHMLRMRGHYFAIGTIAVLEVMREVANTGKRSRAALRA